MTTQPVELVAAAIAAGDARDKQRRIGPSEIGNSCVRCLAGRLIGEPPVERDGYPLAPWIGTAVHAYLERIVPAAHPDLDIRTETKVTVGDIQGYGTITGTADLVVGKHLVDYKVMSKKNMQGLKRAFVITPRGVSFSDVPKKHTAQQYWVQQNLYAHGLTKAGHDIEDCTLLLIPRDATTDTTRALEGIAFPYQPEVAEKALERAAAILSWAESHPDEVDTLPPGDGCFTCKYLRERKSDA